MKETRAYFLVGQSNQELFYSCTKPPTNTLTEQIIPDKRYLQALRLLKPGTRLGTSFPDLEKVRTPDKNSLIAQAVRTARENGGKDFAKLSIEDKARFCATLASTMSQRSRQEAAARRWYGDPTLKKQEKKPTVDRQEFPYQTVNLPKRPLTEKVKSLTGEATKKPGDIFRTVRRGFAIGTGIALLALAGYLPLTPKGVSAANYPEHNFSGAKQEVEVGESKEVPVMSREAFKKWLNRFPSETRKALEGLVTENLQVGFDGRVASEVVSLEQHLNETGGLSFSLSPKMVKEVYGAYIAECEENPSDFWQKISKNAAQGYSSKLKVVVGRIDFNQIPTQPQTAETAKETKAAFNDNRIPEPDFNKVKKLPPNFETITDFDRALESFGYSPEEINNIHELLKINPKGAFSEHNFKPGTAYNIYDLMIAAANSKIPLPLAKLKEGLQYIEGNKQRMDSIDATKAYLQSVGAFQK